MRELIEESGAGLCHDAQLVWLDISSGKDRGCEKPNNMTRMKRKEIPTWQVHSSIYVIMYQGATYARDMCMLLVVFVSDFVQMPKRSKLVLTSTIDG